MLGLVTYLCRFHEIIFRESVYLSDAAKEELPQLGQTFAHMYTTLAGIYFDKGQRLFKITPKLHLMEHLLESQCLVWGNPRLYWCYSDEDLVGLLTGLASSVHPSTLAASLLFKWLHYQFP